MSTIPPRFLATLHGLLCIAACTVALTSTTAHAQKKLDWDNTGSIGGTLIAHPHLIPDIYSFEAEAGENIVFRTSLTDLDTTIRVIGPDASVDIFNDDSNNEVLTSWVDFIAPVSGTYYVIVSTYAGQPTGGQYAFNFERSHVDDGPLPAPPEKP